MPSVTRTAVKPLRGGVGWELSGGEEWTPEAVSVAWDGTSAAGDFVVAVSYYNDGGALIDRAFPEGVTNSPGDTGRTFFRPFKRDRGSVSATGAASVLVQGAATFPAGSSESDIFAGTVASFSTSDATAFTVDALTGCIQVNRDGLYDFWLRLFVSHPAVPVWTDLAFLRMQDPARTFQVNAIDGSGFGSMGINHAETAIFLDDHFTANLYNYEADTGRSFPFNLEVRFGTTYDLTPQSASYAVVGYRNEPLATTWYN